MTEEDYSIEGLIAKKYWNEDYETGISRKNRLILNLLNSIRIFNDQESKDMLKKITNKNHNWKYPFLSP